MSVAWYCQNQHGYYLTGQVADNRLSVVVVDNIDRAYTFDSCEDAARFAAAAPHPGFNPVPHVSHRRVQ